jgi:hypothetical protein
MIKRELVTALVASIILGLVICLVLNGFPRFSKQPSLSTISPTRISEMAAPSPSTPPLVDTPDSEDLINYSPSPTLVPLIAGRPKEHDIEDVLLLFSSIHPNNFDINFCKLAEFYGLLCKRIDLDSTKLTDALLRDTLGSYFRLIGLSASNLQQGADILNKNEMITLRSAIEIGGANLLISNINDYSITPSLLELTTGALLGVTRPQDNRRDWVVSTAAPEITFEFTGQIITSTTSASQSDFALILDSRDSTIPLVSSKDDAGVEYQIFTRLPMGTGSIFLDAGNPGPNLEMTQLRDVYYNPSHFSQILPLMFTIRYALGDEVWHVGHNYANLTIDDPTLTENFYQLNYAALLREMQAHNFHSTIAMIPARWEEYDDEVIEIFLNNPDRYSLVQHGNDHDGYEFYKYTVVPGDPYPANPLGVQAWDIQEGLARMEMLRINTSLSYDRVMIFPYDISPEATLILLKNNNFLATVNNRDVPLDTSRPETWDYGMYPAIMDYGNFAVLTRRHPGTYQPFTPNIQPLIFDLFIGKPALMYSHVYGKELFAESINEFEPVADQLNQLTGGMQWLSLGSIVRRIHLEKVNDDGSVEVRMYAKDLILTNESGETRSYHISKEETLDIPIANLNVNDQLFLFDFQDGLLTLDVLVPAQVSMEICIEYGS